MNSLEKGEAGDKVIQRESGQSSNGSFTIIHPIVSALCLQGSVSIWIFSCRISVIGLFKSEQDSAVQSPSVTATTGRSLEANVAELCLISPNEGAMY